MLAINNRARLVGLAAIVTAVVAVSTMVAQPASAAAVPNIVGGQPASQSYPGMASLQVRQPDNTFAPDCAAILVSPRYVVTGAHCVTNADGSALPAANFRLRIGSTDRTTGGALVTVAKVLPNADWDWISSPGPAADIAMLELAQPVFNVPFFIAQASPTKTTRVLGWGSTQSDGGGAYPVILQQDDTTVLPDSDCAAAGITQGELCIDGTRGSGVCVGDSGGPALQQLVPGSWVAVGLASRGAGSACGAAAIVETDLAYYGSWILRVVLTGQLPPAS